jgi:transposase-like protein
MRELQKIFFSEEAAITFAYNNNILHYIPSCPEDGASLKRLDEFHWKCRKKGHRKIFSTLKETIFENKKLKISEFFYLAYLWLCKVSYTSAMIITGHGSETTTKVYSLIEKLIAEKITPEMLKIGGPCIQVQLDESKFGKRKYNRGHHVEGAWVFAGVEKTNERKCFAMVVEKRDARTLNELILRYVLPGSIVITDGWKGYYPLRNSLNYEHHWVNHNISFTNSEGYNTNTIEGTFNGLKFNIPVRKRVRGRIEFKLFEFIWRRQNKDHLWMSLIEALRS